jgi:mRNA-degrading endonuclease toxin of MazEF toxin-antitoxin module
MIRPGAIYWPDFDFGRHKVVVVSRDELNRGAKALVALVTSARFTFRSTLANCVPLRAGEFGMDRDCVVQCENVFPAFIADLEGPIDALDDERLRDVIHAVGYVIDADCEPA